jgi:hypothetical protein
VVRCGVHLSNLALGSPNIALRLFRVEAIHKVFESEVKLGFKGASDSEGVSNRR